MASATGKAALGRLDPAGAVCFEKQESAGVSQLSASVEAPRLWWTHDQGEPALYLSQVEWFSLDGTLNQGVAEAIKASE